MMSMNPEKKSTVVFGSCNHYFTAHRRQRQIDTKVGNKDGLGRKIIGLILDKLILKTKVRST